jgi:hypothetical protein
MKAFFFEKVENDIWKFQKIEIRNVDVENYEIY